jgi:pimeloyl-ACP methyl ester carboxylesterase
LFDHAGVSSSSGEVPSRIEEMGADAVAFIKALRLAKVDVLGFSMGGLVAQETALHAPDLVKHLGLIATGPRCGEGTATLSPEGRKSSAPPMTSLIIFGFACMSRIPPRAG